MKENEMEEKKIKIKEEKLNKKLKNKKGITLIALVITIIVLLILAGVSIAMLTGDNGILTQAQRTKTEMENAQAKEENTLVSYEQIINTSIGVTLETITGYETSNTVVQDNLGNRVVVPAGFRVVNPEDNIEDGIIIEDVTHSATVGSQFVWIPVGAIHTNSGDKLITLSRYTFDDGIATDQENKVIGDFQELNTGHGNTTAKENIESEVEGFRKSAISRGGYYIARYEARTEIPRSDVKDSLTQITTRADEYVYNYVTQSQAASLSRNMYNDNNFESDLMNSYAWDTAIDFLQKCDDRIDKNTPYSRSNSLNTRTIASQGTNNLETKDQICNVFDMASNCYEWTTETNITPGFPSPGTSRGGGYSFNNYFTDSRDGHTTSYSSDNHAFRPLLYL